MKAEQFLAWRKTNGFSQSYVARLTNKALRTIQRYETGQSAIPDDVAALAIQLEPKESPWITPTLAPHLYKRECGSYFRNSAHPAYPIDGEYGPLVEDRDGFDCDANPVKVKDARMSALTPERYALHAAWRKEQENRLKAQKAKGPAIHDFDTGRIITEEEQAAQQAARSATDPFLAFITSKPNMWEDEDGF